MFVESLALMNFRNYESLDVQFSDKINILKNLAQIYKKNDRTNCFM